MKFWNRDLLRYTHTVARVLITTHYNIILSVQIQKERDDLYSKFVKAIHEVQQKTGFKNLLLEKKLTALADSLEKKEAQLNEVLSASNLDPSALTMVTRKLEVCSTVMVQQNSHLEYHLKCVATGAHAPGSHCVHCQ